MRDGFETKPPVTARQFRAARELLGWTREDAARHCGVGRATLVRLETGAGDAERTFNQIVGGFVAGGIVFYNDERGEGVAIVTRPEAGG